ncbi:MAG: hypothetical protein R3A52_05980 [Polyangiales bacterium]
MPPQEPTAPDRDAATDPSPASDPPSAEAVDDRAPIAGLDAPAARPSRFGALSHWIAPGVALAVAVSVTVRAHWHFFAPWPTPVSNDEGYISALALRMIHGHWLPYVDGVSQRGPILYWLTAAVMKVFGQSTWVPIRGLALTLGLSTLGLVFALTAELSSLFGAGLAALFATYFLAYELNPWDGIGLNGEVLAAQFVLMAWYATARAQRSPQGERGPVTRRVGWVTAAGVLSACAGLSKQMSLAHAGPLVAWLLLGRAHEDDTLKDRLRLVARFALGFVTPYALVVGLYAATGHLREFVYYYQRYGRDIFMAPVTLEAFRGKVREQIDKYLIGITAVTTLGLGVTAATVRRMVDEEGPWIDRLRRDAPALVTLAQVLAAALGACFTGRFFPHYFVQVFPIAAVMAGVAAGHHFDLHAKRWKGALAGAMVLVLGVSALLGVGASALARNVKTRRESDRWYQNPREDPIVRYVVERTQPGEKVFVWGFRAETHVSSGRLPASRFVYSVYPSGVVPWFPSTRAEEEARQVPGARQQLLEDLERERPELVIDAGRSMSGRYMYNYPVLRAYLDRNYCFMRYVDGEPVYRRRRGDHCPPADY